MKMEDRQGEDSRMSPLSQFFTNLLNIMIVMGGH